MKSIFHAIPLIVLSALLASSARIQAQAAVDTQGYSPYQQDQISHISALRPGDEAVLELKRKLVNDIAKEHSGSSLNGKPAHDLDILQRLLDEGAVTSGQKLNLQAMGVVLGDIYAADSGLKWVVYNDDMGKSLAIQIGNTEEVLFPVTMISRLVEAGIRVKVKDIYDKGLAIVQQVRNTPALLRE